MKELTMKLPSSKKSLKSKTLDFTGLETRIRERAVLFRRVKNFIVLTLRIPRAKEIKGGMKTVNSRRKKGST